MICSISFNLDQNAAVAASSDYVITAAPTVNDIQLLFLQSGLAHFEAQPADAYFGQYLGTDIRLGPLPTDAQTALLLATKDYARILTEHWPIVYTLDLFICYFKPAVDSARLMRANRQTLIEVGGGAPVTNETILSNWFYVDLMVSFWQFLNDDLAEALPTNLAEAHNVYFGRIIGSFPWTFNYPRLLANGNQVIDRAGQKVFDHATIPPYEIRAYGPDEIAQAKFELNYRQQQARDRATIAQMELDNAPIGLIRDVSAMLPTNPAASQWLQDQVNQAIAGSYTLSFDNVPSNPSLPADATNRLTQQQILALVTSAFEIQATSNPINYRPATKTEYDFLKAVNDLAYWKANGPTFTLLADDNKGILKVIGDVWQNVNTTGNLHDARLDKSLIDSSEWLFKPWIVDPNRPAYDQFNNNLPIAGYDYPPVVLVDVFPREIPIKRPSMLLGIIGIIVGAIIAIAVPGIGGAVLAAIVGGVFGVVSQSQAQDFINQILNVPLDAFAPQVRPQHFKIPLPLNWAQFATIHPEYGVQLFNYFATLVKEAQAGAISAEIARGNFATIPDPANVVYDLSLVGQQTESTIVSSGAGQANISNPSTTSLVAGSLANNLLPGGTAANTAPNNLSHQPLPTLTKNASVSNSSNSAVGIAATLAVLALLFGSRD